MGEQAARKRERREARAHSPAVGARPPAVTAPARRVMAVLIATVVVIGAAAAGFLLYLSRQSDQAVATGAPAAAAPAASYRAVYRVTDSAGPTPRDQTDVIEARRPDEVRVEHHEGAPPGGRIFSGSIINRTAQTFLPDRSKGFSTPLTSALEPDVYSAPALSAAAGAGAVARLGLGAVLGQQCTRYLYRHTGSEALDRADDRDRVEVCVTSDDILMRQVVTLSGRVVRTAEAVQLDRSPTFAATDFESAGGETAAGAQITEKVVEGRPPDQPTVVGATPPPGFRLDRQLTDSHQEIDTPLLPFYIQSYVRGTEFAIVQQLLVANAGNRPWQSTGADPVQLSNGQIGQVLYHTGYVEVQSSVNGFPVRVIASGADVARYFAASLHAS
ncbi:MAG TPA: hypothetical protein VH134_17185 [Candidatus Dormibacteraeota bacterium]|jgi:hypothetical protein|nr:hypothetical protein [Candidatus Dormibacteraeota bacterium]